MTRAAGKPIPLFGPSVGWLTDIYRKRMAFLLVCAHPEQFRHDFMSWLVQNFHVWEAFEREANKVWDRGRRHYSARTIIEWLRHESAMRELPNGEWKINNNPVPDLGRLYMLFYPERDGFFERRAGPLTLRAK